MTNTATRVITRLMLLQRQPNQKASELAQELGVSVRIRQSLRCFEQQLKPWTVWIRG